MNLGKKYRQAIGAVVINEQGSILICERSDIPGAWQIPQGGIETGETAETACRRELREEIGTSEVGIVRVGEA